MISFEDQTDVVDDDVVPPEAEETYVIMIGDMSTGYRPVGPFDSFDDAQAWAQEYIGTKENTWVMHLCHPNSRDAHVP